MISLAQFAGDEKKESNFDNKWWSGVKLFGNSKQ